MQRHTVVISRQDGGIEVYPLKGWLRQHRDVLPELDPSIATSHQLRAALRRLGWTMEESAGEVRLIQPGTDAISVEQLIGHVDPEQPEAEELSFSLEYQLRDFIATNINTIEIIGRRLRLYVDPADREGVEYPTAVGPIDILAVDAKGSLYVFELKRAKSPDSALGQLARYMGWLKQTIGKDREVHGVIVAKAISQNLRYAASVMPGIHLLEYSVEFSLRAAHDLP